MNRKGFTIVELAIVLVLVGILITLGIKMIGPLTQRTKTSDTKGTIDAAVEAVVGFAATNRRLPGINPVPPSTIPEYITVFSKANDSWGNPIEYIVDSNLTDTADAICGRKTTFLTIRRCTSVNLVGACTAYAADVQNVAFLALSRGANFNNQTTVTRSVSATTSITIYDAGLNNVDDYTSDVGGIRRESYDDIAKWVTLNELRTKVGCAGQQLKILNNELPSGTTGAYSADIYATEGVPFGTSPNTYRWCVNTLPTTGLQLSAGAITAADCSTATTWGTATATDRLTISKHSTNPLTSNSYLITIVVRDNSGGTGTLACNNVNNKDNCTKKSFVITISP